MVVPRPSAAKKTPTMKVVGAFPAPSAGLDTSSPVLYPTKCSHTLTCCPHWLPPAVIRTIVEKLKKGHKAGNKTFKVHIDGYNMLPFLKGEVKQNPREGF